MYVCKPTADASSSPAAEAHANHIDAGRRAEVTAVDDHSRPPAGGAVTLRNSRVNRGSSQVSVCLDTISPKIIPQAGQPPLQ
jgi:hypothetical protein